MMFHRSTKARRTRRGRTPAIPLLAVVLVAASWAAEGRADAGPRSPVGQVTTHLSVCACLRPGDSLHRGDALRSPDGRFVMWLQGDGNLVEYAIAGNRGLPLWVRGNK